MSFSINKHHCENAVTIVHCGILVPDSVNKQAFIDNLVYGKSIEGLETYKGLFGLAFSSLAIEKQMRMEQRYDKVRVAVSKNRKLKSFSSGERKKEFLEFCLSKEPDFLILDNPFDHLDADSRKLLAIRLEELSKKIPLLQLVTRQSDLLPFINNLKQLDQAGQILMTLKETAPHKKPDIGIPLSESHSPQQDILVSFNGVSVNYDERKILNNIYWKIGKGEFWQLIGPNGSGKTTLLDIITGENTKGYGQELYVFGKKKGSGESIWEIKKNIGYFSPAMIDLFQRTTSVAEMLLSGFYDSIGLYQKPTDLQQKKTIEFLKMVGMEELSNKNFHSLSVGQQRVVLILRAMVKQPPLLILDEPTEGMDDHNAALVIQLINLLVNQSHITTVMVSHRSEPGLLPTSIYQLSPGKNGSTGEVKSS